MNRDNVIAGQSIDRHPLSDKMPLAIYGKAGTVIAGQAQIAGVIKTPEGDMRFQAGDWILTDNPPTHAWPVRGAVFEITYDKLHDLEEGQLPTSSPEEATGRVPKSAPPADVVHVKAQEIGMERAGAEDSTRTYEPQVSRTAPSAPMGSKGDKAAKNAPAAKNGPKSAPAPSRTADSSSLKLVE
jgi:hypothetical protein